MNKSHINSYDFDGTLTTGLFSPVVGVDIVLTGRTFNESEYVHTRLEEMGIGKIAVFFNYLHIDIRGDHSESARRKSALHKVDVLTKLSANHSVTHFEDDPIQIEVIRGMLPYIEIVEVPNKSNSYYGESK